MDEILRKYQGLIINLKVVEKTENGVILEKLEGYDCFLHRNHISADTNRGKALLSLLNIGDFIDVVVIKINRRYGSFDVSTRVFEEQNTLIPKLECHEIVIERQKRRLERDEEDLHEYRSILNRLLSDLNREGETFAFELLQNADDYPNEIYDNQVRITFELKNDYLLVKHDGSPFNESNVKSICSILLSDQERLDDESKIGYKGIGFKSVFRYTNWIYIHSGNFSFRFDKESKVFDAVINRENIPWEVIPILTDEIEVLDQITDFEFFNKPVGFALKIDVNDAEYINNTLEKVLDNPTVILFLRHIRRISFKVNSHEQYLQVTQKINVFNEPNVLLFQDIDRNNDINKYGLFNNSFIINDPEVIEELLRDEIPERFKQFRNPKITFAFKLKGEELHVKEMGIDLFFYLPLRETSFGFPFYINSDFIPDLDRTRPLENLKYNRFIMFNAGALFVDLLVALSESNLEIKYQSPILIPENDTRDDVLLTI